MKGGSGPGRRIRVALMGVVAAALLQGAVVFATAPPAGAGQLCAGVEAGPVYQEVCVPAP